MNECVSATAAPAGATPSDTLATACASSPAVSARIASRSTSRTGSWAFTALGFGASTVLETGDSLAAGVTLPKDAGLSGSKSFTT